MDIDIKALSNEYSDKHILVIGDIVLDAYIYGKIDRISQEAPVPIVTIDGIATVVEKDKSIINCNKESIPISQYSIESV